MAKARIIDFSKLSKDKEAAPSAAGDLTKKKTESVNYLLVDARRKINDAMEILFTKDSNLRKLAASKASAMIGTERASEEAIERAERGAEVGTT